MIDQVLSAFQLRDSGAQGWFWRTARGVEVDLLVETAGRLIPLEIKLHSAPTVEVTTGLRQCMSDLGLQRGDVVHAGRERYSLGDGVTAIPAEALLASPAEIRRL